MISYIFWVVFLCSLIFFIIVERIVNVTFILLMAWCSFGKNIQAKQVMVSQVNVLGTFVASICNLIVRQVVYLVSLWALFGLLFFVFSMLYVTYEETPQVWVSFMVFYNSNVGPWLHEVLIWPMYIINMFFKSIIPLWNSVIWFVNMMITQGIFPMILDELSIVLKIVGSLGSLVQTMIQGIITYIQTFNCQGADCFLPGAHMINIMTPMGHARQMIAVSTKIANKFCTLTAVPVDLLIYPFMDINFAEFVHNMVNAIMELVFSMPQTTITRCSLAKSDTFRIMLCTPDINPLFQYLVASFTSLGIMFDNWLNVILVILEEALTQKSTTCNTGDYGLITDIYSSMDIFNGKPTTIVGLTDWMYAITNGETIVYKGHNGNTTKFNTWPALVKVQYGIAAVSYAKMNGLDVSVVSDGSTKTALQTTAMLGCRCSDVGTTLRISCSVIPMEGIVNTQISNYNLDVFFPNTQITKDLQCENLDIHVKSNRWSFYRYSSGEVAFGDSFINVPSNDCISQNNCRSVDATVWVVPRCGDDKGNTLAICLPTSVCFPYCMGARISGSMNNNVILAGAKQWKSGKTIIDQDCYMHSQGNTLKVSLDNPLYSSTTISNQNVYQAAVNTPVYATADNPTCYHATNVMSTISDPSVHTSVYNTYFSSQPFVITGDVIMTSKPVGDQVNAVVIDRMYGDEQNIFYMQSLNQEFPAEPPLNVPSQEFRYDNEQKILIPYATQMTYAPAVSSRNYVFYASNPDYNVYDAFYDYCNAAAGALGKFGLIITSSYGPIRIYRVNAYKKCGTYTCGGGMVRSVDLDGFALDYTSKCAGKLNVSVTHLEYLNEDNIAIVVSSADVNHYDVKTMTFYNMNTTVYWLNPATMQLSNTIWQTYLPPVGVGTLCPSMQRLPRIGSFVAELINAGVYFIKYLMQIPLYMPGLIPIWQAGGRCPQSSYGHSMLANCGNDIFSLEDFFDAIADSQSIIWHSLSSIANLIPIQTQPNMLTDLLNGMAEYGEGTIDLWSLRKAAITLTKVPIKEQLNQFWGIMQSGSAFSSMHFVQGSMIMWVRFSYKFISDIVLAILKSTLAQNYMTNDAIWQTVWAVMYDNNEYYSATVTRSNELACSGIQLMMGVDNPWAEVAYFQCMSTSYVIDNMLDAILNMNVYIPMAVCVCVNSNGYNTPSIIANKCAPQAPVQVRPELYMISKLIEVNAQDYCETILTKTKDKVIHSMDPWFQNMYSGLYALSEALDYMLILFDSGAGQCNDFQGDPHVVSIIPQPIDYFLKCSGTSLCKTKCGMEWENFQDYKSAPTTLAPYTVMSESMFFPGQYNKDYILQNATAFVQIDPVNTYCVQRDLRPDVALVVAEYSNNKVFSKVWCVPQVPNAYIYVAGTFFLPQVELPGEIMQSYFIKKDASVLVFLLHVHTTNQVYFLDSNGLEFTGNIPAVSDRVYIDTLNIWPILDTVCVDVLYKNTPNNLVIGVLQVFMLHFCWQNNQWERYNDQMDLSMYATTYLITQLIMSDEKYHYLLLPKKGQTQAYHVTIERISTQEVKMINEPLSEFNSKGVLPYFSDMYVSPFNIDPDYILVIKNTGWNWLQRIEYSLNSVSTVSSSFLVPIQITPEGRCDEYMCTGCPSLVAQRLCQAYRKCALIRCVGTLVNEIRPLCAIGLTVASFGTETLQLYQGAWVIFSEMLVMIMKLSMNPGNRLDITWPDDIFMGYICSAKDKNVELFSIATSILNSMIQLIKKPQSPQYRAGNAISNDVDASNTIQMTNFNAFLAQLTLSPLYSLIVMKQIMFCQLNGALAFLDNTGYSIRVTSEVGYNTSSMVAGACLTLSNAESSGYQYITGNRQASAEIIIFQVVNFLTLQILDPFLHMFDGGINYAIGVIHSFATWVMSMFPEHCNPPDYFLKDVIKCACDDTRVTINSDSSKETFVQYAHWCSGTLAMTDENSNYWVIYNPYSYYELQQKAIEFEKHAQCMSQRYDCTDTRVDIFTQQGVTLSNVIVKCRENFLKKQWDPFAFALYHQGYRAKLQILKQVLPSTTSPIAQCLLNSHTQGTGPGACMDQYINGLNLYTPEQYWAYSVATETAAQYTDACIVFTGPGVVHKNPTFAACVDGYESDINCTLNPGIWEVVSVNDIPIADPHIVKYDATKLDSLVQKYYKRAYDRVTSTLLQAIYEWSNQSNPNVVMDFFSAEGDAIHQILDCIYLGPYSQVNYWPIPPQVATMENLKGPSWWRDDTNGQTRAMDLTTCDMSLTLPWSCGSQSRRSVIKYFVKNILSQQKRASGNSNTTLIQKTLLNQLRQMLQDWNDISKYACKCQDDTHSPTCCSSDSTKWLPDNLRREFQEIKAEHVLSALEDEYDWLYNFTMQNPTPWVIYNSDASKYDWVDSIRAVNEGLHNPNEATTNYQDNLLNVDDSQSGLWGLCHASLKQVFFTIPVKTDNTLYYLQNIDLYDGNPEKLEEHIKQIIDTAWLHSPLYRHYHPRYHPSDSMMCPHDPVNTATSKSYFNAFSQNNKNLLESSEILGNNVGINTGYYQQYSLGEKNCFCGWSLVNNKCQVPSSLDTCTKVCLLVPCVACQYDYYLYNPVIISNYSFLASSWTCPWNSLSPAWGITDADTTQSWISGNQALTLSTRDLLKYGRSGLRLGNIMDINANPNTYINPKDRVVPLEYGNLTTCDYDARIQLDPLKLAEELFPIAHGLEEGAVAAYCLRYLIEKARFMVLQYTVDYNYDVSVQAFSQQRDIMETWARKCGNQLYLLHLCVSLKVFQTPIPSNNDALQCPFFKPETDMNFYLTANCLVFIDGSFYDPCRCMTCKTTALPTILIKTNLISNPECKLRFDPRDKATNIHAPLGLWEGVGIEYINYLNMSLLEHLLEDNDAVANTPVQEHWSTSEGFMHTHATDCDMFVDYWDDNWFYPVGYHPTTTCDAEDNAYRTFMNSFAQDTDSSNKPILVHQNDWFRTMSDVDIYWGVNGFCRKHNFGMPLVNLNTIVYCTRVFTEENVDPTIPGYSSHSQDYTNEKCAEYSTELPWDTATDSTTDYQSFYFSVGTLPHMPSDNSQVYPENLNRDMQNIASQRIIQDSWNSECIDYPILYCSPTNQPCTNGYVCRGKRCMQSQTYMPCTSDTDCGDYSPCMGLCLEPSVQCIRHSDCTETPQFKNSMCDGMGRCVPPIITIQNTNLTTNYSLQFQVLLNETQKEQTTIGETYSLKGASFWGYMEKDLLKSHGMCSYYNWYTYKEFYLKQCMNSSDSDVCWINPFTTEKVDLKTYNPTNNTEKWWQTASHMPANMYIRPTFCDKDYERLQGFALVRPYTSDVRFFNGFQSSPLNNNDVKRWDYYTKAYTDDGKIAIARINTSIASNFLYTPELGNYITATEDPLQGCLGFSQCIMSPFTRNFVNATRRLGNDTYNPQDTFICGAVGYIGKDDKCHVDTSVFPLYNFFCNDAYMEDRASCMLWNVPDGVRAAQCNEIHLEYPPNYDDIVSTTNKLKNMFYMFTNSFQSIIDVMKTTDCALDLYSHIKNSGLYQTNTLYYPMNFILKEFPYDWFYQCIMLSYKPFISEAIYSSQNCNAYTAHVREAPNVFNFMNYTRNVRAGFSYREFVAFQNERYNTGRRIVDTIAKEITDKYPDQIDQSYPICYKYRTWKTNLEDIQNMLVYNYYSPMHCDENWQRRIIAAVNLKTQEYRFASIYDKLDSIKLGNVKTFTNDNYDQLKINTRINMSNWKILLSETYMDENGLLSDWYVTQKTVPTLSLVDVTKQKLMATWKIQESNMAPEYFFNYTMDILNTNEKLDNLYYIDNSAVSSMSYAQNVLDVPSRCAYTPEQVGITDTSTCTKDALWSCNGKTCSHVIPIYSHVGKFLCHYHYLDDFIVNNNINLTNANTVYSFFFTYIKNNFNEQIPSYTSFKLKNLSFFEDFEWMKNWDFNLNDELVYTKNNQPDTTKSVMCVVTDKSTVNFAACNHPHWKILKKHAEKYYKHKAGVVVQANEQFQWITKSDMFFQGFIPIYSSTNRTDKDVYLEKLFDENQVCTGGDINYIKDLVCYKYKTPMERIGVITPWMHGMYNPYERCDIQYKTLDFLSEEFIDAYIFSPDGQSISPPDMPLGSQCIPRNAKRVLSPSPKRFTQVRGTSEYKSFEYNLCHYQPVSNMGCNHDQGILGGFSGLFVGPNIDVTNNMFYKTKYTDEYNNYQVATDLYSNSIWKIPSDFYGGLFDDTNLLWQGQSQPAGFLRVPPHEIGIHHIGLIMTTQNNKNMMLVRKLPLSTISRDTMLTDFQSTDVFNWTVNLQKDLEQDHNTNRLLYGDIATSIQNQYMSYTCPLKRYAFYGRNGDYFRPISPSPLRARFLFARFNKNRFSHPTMTHNLDGRYFGTYSSTNGFCFCPNVPGVAQTHCQISIAESSPCSMDATLESLKAIEGLWSTSYVFTPKDKNRNNKQCTMQVDWPFVNNNLRDGMPVTGKSPKSSVLDENICHVLDRLPPFQYRYKNTKQTTLHPSKNTITDGVCSTGRVSLLDSVFQNVKGRCVLKGRYSAQTEHLCDQQQVSFSLTRNTPKSPQTMYTKYRMTKRSKCNQCASPPRFVDSNRNTISTESSFGKAYKLSASRVLAQDLRNVLTQNGLANIIDETKWTNTDFLATYLKNPHLLIKNITKTPENTTIDWRKDDRQLWNKPWVYCPSNDALKNNECIGSISREEWINNKLKVCPRTIKNIMQNSSIDPMSRVSFSNIDEFTNKVSLAIAEAREIIIQANCMASGQTYCLPQPFVYHPATYETTNKEWVYNTVHLYYELISNKTCPMTDEYQAYLTYTRNQQLDCPANTFYILEKMLVIIKEVGHFLTILVTTIGIATIKLFAAPFSPEIAESLKADWARVKQIAENFLKLLGDIIIDMLVNSGNLGKQLFDFITLMCNFINDLIKWGVEIVCVFIETVIPGFLNGLRTFISGLINFIQDALNGILTAVNAIKNAGSTILSGINTIFGGALPIDSNTLGGDITFRFDFSGAISVIDKALDFSDKQTWCYEKRHANNGSGVLTCPTYAIAANNEKASMSISATVCWANALASLGQSSMYSCTSSSTCCPASGCSSDKSNLVLCHNCPNPMQGNTHFACENMVCQCGVPITYISYCASNQQCDGSAQCDLVNSFNSPSFGTMQCSLCPGRVMCVASFAGASSKCTCIMNSQLALASCNEAPGTLTYPNPLLLCGYLSSLTDQSIETVFSFNDMMTVPCRYSTRTICATVYLPNGVSVIMPVSYSLRFASSRRLLAEDPLWEQDLTVANFITTFDHIAPEDLDQIMRWPNWNATAMPCNALVHAYLHNNTLGILEEYELQKCAYWRYIGKQLVHAYNLSTLYNMDYFLVSVEDFAMAIAHKDVIVQLLQNSHILYKYLIVHPYMKPIHSFIYYFLTRDIQHTQEIHQALHTPDKNTSLSINVHVSHEDIKVHLNRTSRRKLLTTMSEIQAVQEYTAQVIQGVKHPPIPLVLAQSWIRDPYSWPPKYTYSISDCTIVSVAFQAAKEILSVVANYYAHINDPIPAIDRTIKGNLPFSTFKPQQLVNKTLRRYNTYSKWITYNALDIFQIDINNIATFLMSSEPWTMRWIVWTVTRCDFGSLMSCSRHTKDFFASIPVFIMFYFVIYFFSSALGFPSLATMFLLSFPGFMLWYVYGVSFACLPALPPCLLDDLVMLVSNTFPAQFTYPKELYCDGYNPDYFPNSTVCLKSCETVGFTEFYDPLIYMVCWFDNSTCASWSRYNQTTYIKPITNSLAKFAPKVNTASTFCMFIQFINAVPLLFMILLVFSIASAVIYAIIALIPATFQLIAQMMAFTHTR